MPRFSLVALVVAVAALLLSQLQATAVSPSKQFEEKIDALTDALCAHLVQEGSGNRIRPIAPKACRDAPHLVFVTSEIYDGNLGIFSGADFKCNELASAAGLPGIYKAWIVAQTASPHQVVASRFFRSSGPYLLVDGTIVATDWDDLTDGSLLVPINISETGEVRSVEVWSNVAADGTQLGPDPSDSCNDWNESLATFDGNTGSSTETGPGWTNHSNDTCDQQNALYCVGQ